MIDQAKSLDGEALGNVGIVHGDQVSPSLCSPLLAKLDAQR